MGRRSDHSRDELEALILSAARDHLAETGLARFSGREVAKRVGYSIGTLYNLFGSVDGLLRAVNTDTVRRWTRELRSRLDAGGEDRLAALVHGYFDFARAHPNLWAAIYEHHTPDGSPPSEKYRTETAALVGLVGAELAALLPARPASELDALVRSLVASVHGHCHFAIHQTFDFLGGSAPAEAALERVREAVRAAQRSAPAA
jgi:AcrR family transcriptional regulator